MTLEGCVKNILHCRVIYYITQLPSLNNPKNIQVIVASFVFVNINHNAKIEETKITTVTTTLCGIFLNLT